MSAGLRIPLSIALDALPRGAAGIYVDRARGRCEWVTRIGPHGRRTRELWVLVDLAASAYRLRGMRHVARRLRDLADEFWSEEVASR